MNRGKIIGATVLVVAIGLILAWQLHAPGPSGSPGAADVAAQPASSAVGSVAGAGLGLPPAGESRTFTLVPGESEIYWRIYSGGMMPGLGHNHVISLVDFSGHVTLTSDLATSGWELAFPVSGLVIDDPGIRARYGEDFESVPSDDDKEGTKDNMLREELLNGEVFPQISLVGQGVNGSLENATLPVTVSIVGNEISLNLPASIEISADSLTVSGEQRITHEDLGLTPFSMFGGAIAVADEIDLTYRIHAVAASQ